MQKIEKTPKANNSIGTDSAGNFEHKNVLYHDRPFVVREAQSGLSLKLKEIWDYHELMYFLVWRDIIVRYKQTTLGAGWAILQPLLTMVIFSIFFGKLGNIPSDGLPYPIFSYTALLPWQLFANALTNSSNSLVSNRDLVTKVYFPRLIIPSASIISGFVDFCIAFLVLVGMMFYYGIRPSAAIFTLPIFILFAMITALSVGLWLSALNVKYRDVRYTIPFLTQLWLFLTPIAYPSSMVPEKWRFIYGLNPMAGVVEGFRWALLGQPIESGSIILTASVMMVIFLFVGGLIYFRRMERTFADVI